VLTISAKCVRIARFHDQVYSSDCMHYKHFSFIVENEFGGAQVS